MDFVFKLVMKSDYTFVEYYDRTDRIENNINGMVCDKSLPNLPYGRPPILQRSTEIVPMTAFVVCPHDHNITQFERHLSKYLHVLWIGVSGRNCP